MTVTFSVKFYTRPRMRTGVISIAGSTTDSSLVFSLPDSCPRMISSLRAVTRGGFLPKLVGGLTARHISSPLVLAEPLCVSWVEPSRKHMFWPWFSLRDLPPCCDVGVDRALIPLSITTMLWQQLLFGIQHEILTKYQENLLQTLLNFCVVVTFQRELSEYCKAFGVCLWSWWKVRKF